VADILALFDANVFYGMTLTDLVMETARAGLCTARWTEAIHDEWTENLLKNQPLIARGSLIRRRRAMNAAVRDAVVTGYEPLIPGLTLPDPNDRHVLAAAITAQCQVIVTSNLKDFPPVDLAPFKIVAVHPDPFFVDLMGHDVPAFLMAIKTILKRMRNPPFTPDTYVAQLRKVGLPMLAAEVERHKGLI
jgi:PIN domain